MLDWIQCGIEKLHRYIIVLQVPSRYAAENPIENLKQFKTEVPVLGLLGTQVAIEHNSNFDVTDDVQLVCKYLKAYETKRIDKLFKEGKQFCPLVKTTMLTTLA